MNKSEMTIWGRKFNIDICYDCYDGETITSSQKESFEKLINSSLIDDSLSMLKEYIIKSSHLDSPVENVFKYVKPKCIYLRRSKTLEASLLCDYKFDMEHGLAMVFVNNKLKEIGSQDIAL